MGYVCGHRQQPSDQPHMGTAFTPAKTSPASWDAFSDVDAFVDAVLAELAAMASVLHGWAGWRKGRPVSMLRVLPSCRTNTMPTVATTLRGRSDV